MIMHAAVAQQQYWNSLPGGNTITNNEWFGADANSLIPLEIRHNAGDQPIEFYTTGDNISEMWLKPTLTNFVFNTYTSPDLSGNSGVSV